MELFSEIYGCYYCVVAQILRQSHGTGLSRDEINRIVSESAFSESEFHLLQHLLGGEWDFLRNENGLHYSNLSHKNTAYPLTALQKAWLKSLLRDRRIRLFLDETRLYKLDEAFYDVEPLFEAADFHTFDAASDGDDYCDDGYVQRFRFIMYAIKQKKPFLAQYESGKGRRMGLHFLPQKILYSEKDNKFRVTGLWLTGGGSKPLLLNLARIREIMGSDRLTPVNIVEGLDPKNRRTVRIAISNERNALERCMLQFASYEKYTVCDEDGARYICDISYDPLEETELLIRILSFGPVIEVLAPGPFLQQIRERVRLQIERMQLEEYVMQY